MLTFTSHMTRYTLAYFAKFGWTMRNSYFGRTVCKTLHCKVENTVMPHIKQEVLPTLWLCSNTLSLSLFHIRQRCYCCCLTHSLRTRGSVIRLPHQAKYESLSLSDAAYGWCWWPRCWLWRLKQWFNLQRMTFSYCEDQPMSIHVKMCTSALFRLHKNIYVICQPGDNSTTLCCQPGDSYLQSTFSTHYFVKICNDTGVGVDLRLNYEPFKIG